MAPVELYAVKSAQLPVAGSVPYSSAESPNSPALTGQTDKGEAYKGWPVPVTKDLVQTGQDRYNIFCVPCHGENGDGRGIIVQRGFTVVAVDRKPKRAAPVPADVVATDNEGNEWWFLVAGGFTAGPSGLRRAEVLWRTLARAAALHEFAPDARIGVLTTAMPVKGTPNDAALRALVPSVISEVIDLSS